MGFYELQQGFRDTHKTSLNVFLHLVTSPLALVATMALMLHGGVPATVVGALATIHSVSLAGRVPTWIAVANMVLNALMATAAVHTALLLPWMHWVGIFCVGYFGQDLAHLFTGEPTFQGTYISGPDGLLQLLEHTYLLMPLVLDAARALEHPIFCWMVQSDRIISTRLGPNEAEDIKTVEQFVLDSKPSEEVTTHWWFETVTGEAKESFTRLAEGEAMENAFRKVYPSNIYAVDRLEGMDEIYVSAPKFKMSSDKTFYMEHVDGPYGVWPFCSVYRCMMAISENKRVITCFPLAQHEWTLTAGDVVGFDFNRELHIIRNHETDINTSFRIALKLHYIVYPRGFGPLGRLLGWLTTRYDRAARDLYLFTLAPTTFMERMSTQVVVWVTWLEGKFLRAVGKNNATYFLLLCAAAWYTGSQLPLLLGGSWVHYLIYIGTFYQRTSINYGLFLRDAVAFKLVALANIVYLYYVHFEWNPLSFGLIGAGVFLASTAAAALGKERTYFASELGWVKSEWITAFPYSAGVPHPMIVGAWMWLLGVHAMDGIREAYPWLIPVHMALYLVHCLQEEFEVHSTSETPFPFRGNKAAEQKRARLA